MTGTMLETLVLNCFIPFPSPRWDRKHSLRAKIRQIEISDPDPSDHRFVRSGCVSLILFFRSFATGQLKKHDTKYVLSRFEKLENLQKP